MKHVYDRLFVGSQWLDPQSSDTIEVVEASTEEVIGQVPQATIGDLDRATREARAALHNGNGWGGWDASARAELLERLADVMEARGEEFARLVSAQNGMPITTARAAEIGYPAGLLRMYAAMVRAQEEEEERAGAFGGRVRVRRSNRPGSPFSRSPSSE
jgi:aldehyde dehydrogenase (NAD+)